MDTFNKKSLCVALAAAGVLGSAGVAQAVNVSADGLGNVLIYPYYTVNKDVNGNSFNTLMSVVNTTGSTKAVKVRFREGKNSAEVLDFNVFLSPFDVWTAGITPTADGRRPHRHRRHELHDPGVPRRRRRLPHAGARSGRQRRDAHVGRLFRSLRNGDLRCHQRHRRQFEAPSAGVPKDCTKVTDATASSEALIPQGGLFGGLTILSPAGGGMFSQPATALANFSTTAAYFDTGSTSPDYANADPVSNTIAGQFLYQTDWTGSAGGAGFDAVTAVLMANAVTNEYVLDIGSKSQTSWIVTLATKFNYVNASDGHCAVHRGVRQEGPHRRVRKLLRRRVQPRRRLAADHHQHRLLAAARTGFRTAAVLGSAEHRLRVDGRRHDVEQRVRLGQPQHDQHAVHQRLVDARLERRGSILSSTCSISPAASTVLIDLVNGGAGAATVATYFGLPVVGFAAQTFQNDAIVVSGKTYLSTFAASFPHHATKLISP